MKRKTLWSAIILVIACALISVSQTAYAQQEAGDEERITLSPAIARPSLDAGQSATGSLTVINNGSTSYTFLLYARPFSVDSEAYDPNYTEINERTRAYQWIQFEKTEFHLEAGERVEVEYTIRSPEDAAGGGHYAVLFAETQPPEDSTNIARKKRVGALLYMTVAGDITRSGNLESWETPLLQTQKPITSTLRMKNDGNIHYQADLTATYHNLFGKKRFELNQELLILPGTTRRIPVEWQDSPYLGIYKASGEVTYLDNTETLPTQYVILLPYPVILTVAALVIAIIFTLILRKRSKPKRYSRFGNKR